MKELSKEEREEIKRLRKEKDFDKIYFKYGRDVFLRYVKDGYRKADIKKLLEERRFLDIYNKYGEKEYNKYLSIVKRMDKKYEKSFEETSMMLVSVSKVKHFFKSLVASFVALTSTVLPTATGVMIDNMNRISIEQNSEKVEEYLDDVKEYSENIKKIAKKENYSDLDIFMKLMDDMWEGIDGYKRAENEINGALGASLKYEKGGVCRNFADDIATKLNNINEKYNARSFSVKTDLEGAKVQLADIDIKLAETNETIVNSGESSNEIQVNDNLGLKKIAPDHAIVAVDVTIDGKAVTMFLDPTNPSISVYTNGEIRTLNSDKTILGVKSQYLKLLIEGGEDYLKNMSAYIGSYFSNIDENEYEKINEMFGIDAQNRSLKKVRKDKEKNMTEKLSNLVEDEIEVSGEKYSISYENNAKEDFEKSEDKEI
ncbi:MAG: hypothetical protein IJ809_00975 [Clostridia bacterium]|nr:hypothetical protein [Clostridia bacterium]